MMTTMMTTRVDAHKRRCTALVFDGDSVAGSFDFSMTRRGVSEFVGKVPEGSTVMIEANTTGKMLSQKYDVHMVAPLKILQGVIGSSVQQTRGIFRRRFMVPLCVSYVEPTQAAHYI